MRKILSLVLVLSMVLGSFSFAFALPADVEGTDFEDAVTRLSALEILSGYSDGTFKPEKTITRAEFAKIMANILGVGEAAKYAAGATKFDDVAADHWAAGYINVVSDMKIINGYGNGSFGPQDNVTYAQAVTMIVRALGYEPKATAMGGYPGGYLAVAAEEDITDDVTVVNTLAATRGDVALMVDAALDVPLMYQKTWGQYPEFANDDESKTLLTEKLGVDELEGTVVAIPNTDSTIEENEIKLTYAVDSNTTKTKTLELLVDANYDSLLGLEVTVWADGSDVFFLTVDTDEDDIIFDTASGDSTDEVISLYVKDDDYDWDKDAKAYLNHKEVKLEEIPKHAYGYVVLDSNDDVTYANFFNFDEIANGVITEVKDDYYTYYDANANDRKLEFKDYDDGVFVYTDKFVKADADIIDVDSTIFAWETSDELYVVVKNASVSGTLEKVKSDRFSVDGETVYASIFGTIYSDDAMDTIDSYDEDITKLDNLDDEAVKVVYDLNDEAFLIVGESEATSSTIYGIVTYATVGKDAELTVFTKDDDEFDYTAEDRSDFDAIDYEKTSFNYLGSGTALTYSVISFKLNSDGEIDNGSEVITTVHGVTSGSALSAVTTTGSDYGLLSKSEDKAYVYLDGTKRFYVSEDTVLLQAIGSTNKLAPSVIKYDDFVDMKIADTNASAVVYGDEGKDADMIVFVDEQFKGSKVDYFYGIATDKPWKDGSDYVVSINVFGEGEKDYVIPAIDTVEKGDIIAFTLDNNNELVREAKYDLSEASDADNAGASAAFVDKKITFDTTEEIVLHHVSSATVEGKYIKDGSTNTWKMESDAIVYELTSKKALDDEVGYNRIGDGDEVVVLVDEDEKVVASIIWEYKDNTPVKVEPVISDLKVVLDNGGANDVTYTVTDKEVTVNVARTTAATPGYISLKIVGDVSDDDTLTAGNIQINGKALTSGYTAGTFTYNTNDLDFDVDGSGGDTGLDLSLEIPVEVKVTDKASNVTTETFTIKFVDVPEI